MATVTKPQGTRRLPQSYFDLVSRFPLMHIVNDRHLAQAHEVLDGLLQENIDRGGKAYLEVLEDLIEEYEDRHTKFRKATEAEVLRELMNANQLSQPQLAKRVGIAQSTISAVLNGTRSLTKQQIITLARHFNMTPAAFLPT